MINNSRGGKMDRLQDKDIREVQKNYKYKGSVLHIRRSYRYGKITLDRCDRNDRAAIKFG